MHPLTILKYAHKTILDSVEGLAEAEWDIPGVCGLWSVKQVIGHLNGWEHYFIEFIAPFAGAAMPTPHVDEYKALDEHAYNEKYGTAAASRSRQELMDEFNAAYERSLQLAGAISPETWHRLGTLPWSHDSDLEDFVAYSQYAHKHEHAAQIVVFRDRLKTPKA